MEGVSTHERRQPAPLNQCSAHIRVALVCAPLCLGVHKGTQERDTVYLLSRVLNTIGDVEGRNAAARGAASAAIPCCNSATRCNAGCHMLQPYQRVAQHSTARSRVRCRTTGWMLLALRLCGNTVRCERHAPSCFARSGVFLLAALASFRHARLEDPVAHQADQRSFLHAGQIARACVKRLLALYECSVYQ